MNFTHKYHGLLAHFTKFILSCEMAHLCTKVEITLYTPGQKLIEFFLNELLHQDNSGNPQFVNAGMETHHISTHL